MTRKLFTVATACALTAGAGAVAIPAFAATKTVKVEDDKFVASTLTVKKGTTVKWVWRGDSPHDVVVTKGPATFKSTVKTSGSYSRKLTKKGVYSVLCTIHAPNMKMKITVR